MDKLLDEINIIYRELNAKMKTDISEDKDFHVGEYIKAPNQYGCFKKNLKWYTYIVDERNYCTIKGPYSLRGIIYACAILVNIEKDMKEFYFSPKELQIFYNNHFRSIEELDEYEDE